MCIISDLEIFLFFLKVISGHLGWVRCIAVEPGNQWFVTGSADRTIKVRVGRNHWQSLLGVVFCSLIFKKSSALGNSFLVTACKIMMCRVFCSYLVIKDLWSIATSWDFVYYMLVVGEQTFMLFIIFNLKCSRISYIWDVYPDYQCVAFTCLPQNT